MHPFRFGMQVSRSESPKGWRELARRCESLGYSTLFIPDHLDDQYSPLVALTVAAEATESLAVGTLVLDNDFRHPLLVAKEAATLDLLSEGRLELGLGAGWMQTDYDESGIAYDPPGVRVDRLEEALEVIRRLFTEELVTYAGEHYQLTAAHGLPRPHRPGGPKVLVGGGSRRVLSLAARTADIVGINPRLAAGRIDGSVIATTTPAAYAERIGWVREAAGERFDAIELQSLVFAAQIGRPQAVVAEELAGIFGYPPGDVAASAVTLLGTEDEIVETLQRRREELGFSYWVLHEAELESFAPVVARLAGT